MNQIVELAKEAIRAYVTDGKIICPPDGLPEEMHAQAGVFVSIKKHGELRGCIGTFAPTTENIAFEIIRNAIESATRDPRFTPVLPKELPDLVISVDVLTDPVPVKSKDELDPKRYGVIVKSGMKRGLLLPALSGVDTPEQQIAICMRKAGISSGERIELFKFEVRRYKEMA